MVKAARKPNGKGREKVRPASRSAPVMDMKIHRSDDEDDASEDIYSLRRRGAPPKPNHNAPLSEDETSAAEEGSEEEGGSESSGDERTKTISAKQLTFLSGLERNKALNVSQKDAKLKAKQLKKSDRKELEQLRKTSALQQRQAALFQQQQDDEEEDEVSSEFEEEEMQEPRGLNDKYQEYSDVSEGEDVESTSSTPPPVAVKKRKVADDDQHAEEVYMARLGKRREREQHLEQVERAQRLQAKLPVRKLDEDESDSSEDDDSDSDGGDENRAVHDPVPKRADSPETIKAAQEAALALAARKAAAQPRTSITHSSRFNLTAPYEILLTSHPCRLSSTHPRAVKNAKTQTLLMARNQIASLASQIVADPEVNIGFLRRLMVFAARTVHAPPEKVPEIREEQQAHKANPTLPAPRPVKVEVDIQVRQLAILSLLAVFVDIMPGYRIRSLTDAEAAEKVGQDVARRREFESSLVSTYREFLEMCETELKGSLSRRAQQAEITTPTTPLQTSVIRVFVTLATRATHFNYRQNILSVLISRMSRRTWGQEETDCFTAVQQVVKEDRQGSVSLEVVRLIHRMTKERKYKVHAKVFDILLDLRLRNELGNKRSSTTRSTDPEAEAARARKEADERRAAMKAREAHKAGKNKATPNQVRKGLGQHLSKKQVKAKKALKLIEQEMKEAEATIDLEEREQSQTETLKLVFVLYFTLLKMPPVGYGRVDLGVLESALRGLSMYAHRVNVDFFRDLLNVLRQHVAMNAAALDANAETEEQESGDEADADRNVLLDYSTLTRTIRHIIIALKTTFDLFLGQPETAMLNLDLTDLLSHFYGALFYLPFVPDSHLVGRPNETGLIDLALDSLNTILIRARTRFDASTLASFAKRLCVIALHISNPTTLCKLLTLVSHLLTAPSTSSSDSSQRGLLDLQDKSRNGKYDALGKVVSASAILTSGQSIVWELAMLRATPHLQVQQAVEKVYALAHEDTK